MGPMITSLPADVTATDASIVLLCSTPWRQFQSSPTHRPIHHHYDFANYIHTLPLWEQELLEHIEFIMTPDELTDFLAPAETSPATLLLVSDASDTAEAMSFSWILGTQTGRPLVQNYGPGFGIPSSHRAEACGMLSGTRFLLHLTIYTRTPFPEHIKVESMSDNKGLIQRTTERQTYANVYANSMLAPDWDITEEIHTAFEALKLTNQAFTWVKGHQGDDTASYDALPVEAKYNVQADDLADQFMHQYGKARMLSPLLPAAKCMLQIDTKTHCVHTTLKPSGKLSPSLNCLLTLLPSTPRPLELMPTSIRTRYRPPPTTTRPRTITSSNWSITNSPPVNTSRNPNRGCRLNAGIAPIPKLLTT
jgi:hypothetical protein